LTRLFRTLIIRFDPKPRKEKSVLDLMRKHAKSWFIKIALAGIAIVFVFFFGWGGRGGGGRQDYAAKVNDTVITYDDFQNALDTETEKIKLRFGGSIPPDFLDKLDLKKQVIQGLVTRTVLLQEAQRLGLFVTDEDLIRDIRSNPVFQRNGVFDDGNYNAFLRSIKLSPSAYEDARKKDLLARQVVRLLTDGVKTYPAEIKRLWHFQNDKLVLSMLTIKPQQKIEAPDAKDLEAYFKKNQSKYEFPATVSLEYVAFSWRDVRKSLSVPEDEVKAYYQTHPKEFLVPEQIKARHILLKIPKDADKEKIEEIRKKAEAVREKISGGEDFEKVAKKESEDEATAQKGGDLGFISRGSLNPALEKAAFKLGIGKISEPILTAQGYHIIRVDEKKPETQIDFEKAKPKIEEKLLEQKARKKVAVDADKFYEKVYRSEDLRGPAKEFGFGVREKDGVSKAGGIPDLGDDPKIMQEAFQLRTGEISRLVRSGDNYVVMKLLERIKERVPNLDEVRSAVEKDFLKNQAREAAMKKAGEIIAALKKQPNDPDVVTRDFGLKWTKMDPVSRTSDFVPELGKGPEVKEMLTTVSPATPLFPKPIPATNGIAVVRLSEVQPASDEKYEKEAETLQKWVLEVRQTEFIKGWLRVLEDRSQISIKEKL
jgi:peptidyl-prolyl cis-trans isomerase D